MTEQEAIEQLEIYKRCCAEINLNGIMAYNMAITALEEQEKLKETIKTKETLLQLQEATMSILSSDKDTVIDMLNDERKKHRWILCSEQMPPEHDSMFARFKGTEKYCDSMFEKISDDVNVTIEYPNGKRKVITTNTTDGEWREHQYSITKYNVIAWKPLPDPYQE